LFFSNKVDLRQERSDVILTIGKVKKIVFWPSLNVPTYAFFELLCTVNQTHNICFKNQKTLFQTLKMWVGLVVSKPDSRSKGCGFESCRIKNSRWKWGKSHASIDSCAQFWFIVENKKMQIAKWGTPKNIKNS